MQRTVLKINVGGDPHMSIKLERPRKLASKKCLDVYAAACDHFPLLKLAGHKGISFSVYMQGSLFAKFFGIHDAGPARFVFPEGTVRLNALIVSVNFSS